MGDAPQQRRDLLFGRRRSACGVAERSGLADHLRETPRQRMDERVALRLLLDYGIRKGSLKGSSTGTDHQRRRVTLVVAKGGKVRELPIPDRAFWLDLERLILDVEGQPPISCVAASGRFRSVVPTSTVIGRFGCIGSPRER